MLSNVYSSVNSSPAAALTRNPRAVVTVNGLSVLWTDIDLTTTTYYTADSYQVVMPLSGQPASFNLEFLTTAFPIRVNIYIGFPKNPESYTAADLDLMIVGDVDKLDFDPLTKTVTFTGRDLTSQFIDKKTYKKYSEQSASAIITTLAKEHGLNPVVTQTYGKVGNFYVQQNTLMTRETTEWDLMCFLAQQEDFVIYVEKNNLIFKPRPSTSNNAFVLTYQNSTAENASPAFNAMNLRISRSLTLAPGTIVKVRVPFSPQTDEAFTVSASSKKRGHNPQIYSYTFPGLSRDQALAKAQQLLRDITLHELRLDATLPGENTLAKDSMVQLTGTGTTLDQLYFADQIVRRMSITEGYNMEISCKNHNVDSQIIL